MTVQTEADRKTVKIETHCHSAGSSDCATTAAERIVSVYKTHGYGGLVLTNHYCAKHFDKYPGSTRREKLDYYFSVAEHMRRCCNDAGLKFFLGAEVCVKVPEGYAEYILYDFDKSFFYDNPPLYELTQRELFALADGAGVFMYQAHPFRDEVYLGDPRFMHGAEAFNGHFHHANRNDKATRFCKDNSLIQMSGTDYHHFGQPVTGGLSVPGDIEDEHALKECILSGGARLIRRQKLYEKVREKYLAESKKC